MRAFIAGLSLALAANHVVAEPLSFYGKITPERVDKFIAENADSKADTLLIDSEGGDVGAGISLGQWIRGRGMNVRVNVLCVSSCANYVFTAGRRKFLGPNAIVIWHGGMEQQSLREEIGAYEALKARIEANDQELTEDEQHFFATKRQHYELTIALRRRQAAFFSSIGVDEYITRLGQEPVQHSPDAWTATLAAMEKLGIHGVSAPANYGTADFMKRQMLAQFLFKGRPVVFDVRDGELVPLR